MPKILLPQKNLELEAPQGANLMSFLLSQNIPVASSCKGDGICSKCRVQVPGSVRLPNPSLLEINTLKRNKCGDDERLSCQISVENDLEIYASYW